MRKIGFGSDNHSGAHPLILEALIAANEGHEPSYGTDSISRRVARTFESHFGPGTEAFFVFNGTAANVLALSACLQPHHAVLCSDQSHLAVDECGAPERWTGAKLLTIPSVDGKIRPERIREKLCRLGDQHCSQPILLSITQPTELGTVYTLDELRELSGFAKENRLFFHMDGARVVNAAESLGVSLREVTRDVGVDVLSFGGTKNGLVFGEAVVFFRSELARDFRYRRKQAMQLPSKTRFIAAQFEAWLKDDLWHQIAHHSNAMARLLGEELRKRACVEVTRPTQANAVFARFPKTWIAPLREKYFFYVWNEVTFECRLVASFDTTPETVRGFVQALDELQLRIPQESL